MTQENNQNSLYRLLRWSEKYLKTDMVYFSHGSFWLLLGYALQLVTGVILAAAFANLLSKDQYGFYQFVISMSSVIAAFTLTGMGTAIVRAAAQGDNGSLRSGVRTTLKWSSGISLAGIAIAIYYLLQNNFPLAVAFAVVAATQPFITSFNLYKTYLQGKQLFKYSCVVEFGQRILPFGLLLTSISITHNPLILASVYFISQAISSTGAYWYVVKKFNLPKSHNGDLINYSKHLSAMESIGEIANAADKALVWIFLGATPTAIYALAQLPVTHLQTIFGFVRQLAFPKVAQKDLKELVRVLPEKIRMYSLVSLVVVVVYILVAPLLFTLIFPKYPESILYSQILALSVLAVPRSLFSQTFAAHKLKKELYIVNITTPVVRLVCLLAGLPLFGIWGGVGAILVSEWYAAILQWQLFRKIDRS